MCASLSEYLPSTSSRESHYFLEHSAGTITNSDGSTYEGELSYGRYHGKGTHTEVEGDIYTGDFDNGWRHGQGTLTKANGDVYTGDFDNGWHHGQGTLTSANGDVYTGSFKNGRYHGQGTLTSANGDVYTGDFENSQYQGQGTLRSADGDVYTGDFVKYQYHGQGTLTLTNGETYTGGFAKNRYHGQGTLTRAGGNVYSGKFSRNRMLSDKSNLGDLVFARLLFGYEASGSLNGYPLGILSDYFDGTIYEEVTDHLLSAYRIFQVGSDAILKVIPIGLPHGIPYLMQYGCQEHAMGLNLVPTPSGQFVDCEIFNSGGGLPKYHLCKYQEEKPKYETMLRVRVPMSELTSEKIKQLIEKDDFSNVDQCYEAILSMPNAKIILGTGILQAAQKSDNCGLEWIFAFLKNKMPLEDYNKMRLQLFVDCLRQAKENEKNSSKPLTQVIPEVHIRRKLNKLLGNDLDSCSGPLFEEGLHLVKF